MNNEKLNEVLNEQLIKTAFSKTIKVHLKLRDGTFRNGFVTKLSPDFFLFSDDKRKLESFFYLQVRGVDPFTESDKEVNYGK
jgi:hypothetical protein